MPKMHPFVPTPMSPTPALRAGRPARLRAHAPAWLLALAVAGCSASAWAEKADRNQPLNFAADAARVDDAQRLNVLSGNVEITKGSMRLNADRVEVRQNTDGTQSAVATGGPGGRAFFTQKRDGVDETIEGQADKLVYEGRDDTVRFTGRATMRRLKAGVMSDEVSGPVIVYDNKTSVFQVVGATGKVDAPDGTTAPRGRVRGVITPRPAEPESPTREPGASLAPATSLSTLAAQGGR